MKVIAEKTKLIDRLKSMAGSGWAIAIFFAKIIFGIYLVIVALDSGESAGSRAVAAALIVMIWASVLAHEAVERHREAMAKLAVIEHYLTSQGRSL